MHCMSLCLVSLFACLLVCWFVVCSTLRMWFSFLLKRKWTIKISIVKFTQFQRFQCCVSVTINLSEHKSLSLEFPFVFTIPFDSTENFYSLNKQSLFKTISVLFVEKKNKVSLDSLAVICLQNRHSHTNSMSIPVDKSIHSWFPFSMLLGIQFKNTRTHTHPNMHSFITNSKAYQICLTLIP